MASTDARPVPKKNVAFRHYFAVRDNTGALVTTWAGQDSEVSLDGASFSDCTNEATEIGTAGCGYIDLTSSELNADAVMLKVTVTNTNALPYVVTLFPEEAGDIRTDVTQISGDATAADNLEAAADGTGYNLGGSPLTAAVADAVWDETLSDHLNSNSTGLALNSSSSAGDPWNTSLPGVYASGTAGHIIGNAQVTAAQIRTALGLASANLDTQIADLPTVAEFNARTVTSATYASATDLTSVKTVTDKLDTAVELDGSVYRFTTNALEQAPGGSAPTASQVADAVWDELYAGHTVTGSFGLLVGSKLPLISASSVNVASVVDAAGNIKHLFQGADHTTIPIDIPIDGTTLDLSGSGFTLALRLERNVTGSGDAEKCITGYSVISGGTASQKVRFAPTAADTATLAVNASGFDRNPTVYSYWAYKYQVIKVGNASGSDPEVIARGYASVINLIACS